MASVAHAQPSDDAKKEAREHYKNAETAMAGQAYEYAASEYGMAYEIMKDPILFLKIGNADAKAGKCTIAITYYKRYLKEGNPSAEQKKLAEDRIKECGGTTSADTTTNTTALTTTTTTTTTTTGSGSETSTGSGSGAGSGSNGTMAPDLGSDAGSGSGMGTGSGSDDTTAMLGSDMPEKTSGKRTAAWISVATSLAAGTVGAVLLLSANSTEKDIEDLYASTGTMAPPKFDGAAKTRYDELVADGDRFNTLSYISFGVCGAAAVTAIVLFATDHGDEHPAEHALRITPTITPEGGGFAATFHF
ncbi:MAG TPA: hypothetical protein VL463_04910 [Kofleriaceae bacterium]|nr:hypothetical protein [Kofleriaceae bacterium]